MMINHLKKTDGPTTLSYAMEYNFDYYDLEYFKFLKDKYADGKNVTFKYKYSWQNKNEKDLRKQMIDLIKEIAAKNKPSSFAQVQKQQSYNNSDIATMFENYLECLCENNFHEADQLIKKYKLTKYSSLSKIMNRFSLKMLKYDQMCEQNKKLQKVQDQLNFYMKIIQDLHEPASLTNFVDKNAKLPFMSSNLLDKLKKQAILAKEKDEYEKICKGYERVIMQLNSDLSRPVLDFRNTNSELVSFSCKDFKSKSTEESGSLLKKNLGQLVYQISLSKQKLLLPEYQNAEQLRFQKQTLSFHLMKNILRIYQNGFPPQEIHILEQYLNKEVSNNKSILDLLEIIKNIGVQKREISQFERDLNLISITNYEEINKITLKFVQKTPHAQKMEKIFKREFLYRLMQQINTQNTHFNTETLLERVLAQNSKWLDDKVVKSLQKLALKTGKVNKNLVDMRTKLSEILKMTGYSQSPLINLNPNNTDFYIQMYGCIQKIWNQILNHDCFKTFTKSPQTLNKDKFKYSKIELSANNYGGNNNSSKDLIQMEEMLKEKIQKYKRVQKQIIGLFEFDKFQKQFRSKATCFFSRVLNQNRYEINFDQLTTFVKVKIDQINQVFQTLEISSSISQSNCTQNLKTSNTMNLKKVESQNSKKSQIKEQITAQQKQMVLVEFRHVNIHELKILYEGKCTEINQLKKDLVNKEKLFGEEIAFVKAEIAKILTQIAKKKGQCKIQTFGTANQYQYSKYPDFTRTKQVVNKDIWENHTVDELLKKLKKEIQNLKDETPQKQSSQIAEFNKNLPTLNQEWSKILSDKKNQITLLKKSKEEVQTNLNNQYQQLTSKNAQIQDLNNRVSSVIESSTITKDAFNFQISRISKQLQVERQKHQSQLTSLKVDYDTKMKKLKPDIETLRSQNQRMKNQSQKALKLQAQLTQKAQLLIQKDIEIKSLNNKILELQNQITQLVTQIKSLKQELEKSKKPVFRSMRIEEPTTARNLRQISKPKQIYPTPNLGALITKKSQTSETSQMIVFTEKEMNSKIEQETQRLRDTMKTQLEQVKTQSTQKIQSLEQNIKDLTESLRTKQQLESQIRKQLLEKEISEKEAQRLRDNDKVQLDEVRQQFRKEKSSLEEKIKQLTENLHDKQQLINQIKQQMEKEISEKVTQKNRANLFDQQKTNLLKKIAQLKDQNAKIEEQLLSLKQKQLQKNQIKNLQKQSFESVVNEKQQNLQNILSLQEEIEKNKENSTKSQEQLTQKESILQQQLTQKESQKISQTQQSKEKPQQKTFDQKVQDYEWRISCLQNEVNQLSGFTDPKPKLKKRSIETQTDNSEKKNFETQTEQQENKHEVTQPESEKQSSDSIDSALTSEKQIPAQTKTVIKEAVDEQVKMQKQQKDNEDQEGNQSNQQKENVVSQEPKPPAEVKVDSNTTEKPQKNVDESHHQATQDQQKKQTTLDPASQTQNPSSEIKPEEPVDSTFHQIPKDNLNQQKAPETAQNNQDSSTVKQPIQETSTKKQDHSQKVNALTIELKNLISQKESLQSEVLRLSQLITQHQTIIRNLQQQKIGLTDQITKLLLLLQNSKLQIISINQKFEQKSNKVNKVKNDLNQNLEKINQFKENFKLLKQEINQQRKGFLSITNQLTFKISELVHAPEIETLKHDKIQLQSAIENLRDKIKSLDSEKEQLRKTVKTQGDELKSFQKQKAEEIKNIRIECSNALELMKKEKSALKYKLLNLERTGGSNRHDSSLGASSLLKMENDKLRRQYQTALKQLDVADEEIKRFEKKINSIENQLTCKNQLIDQLKNELHATNLTLKQLSKSTPSKVPTEAPISKYTLFDRFFPGEMLEDEHEKKFLLSNAIEKRLDRKIKKTKLIYRYDPLNSTSFHSYIDGKHNFLIVIRTHDNKIFGAFSTEKLWPKYKEGDSVESFIFTFNPETKEPIACFPLNKNVNGARSLVYDEFFLKVGNSEIRWKMGEKTIYSNFGIINGYYDPRGTNVWALLQAEQTRQTFMKGFQCFEVCFEQ